MTIDKAIEQLDWYFNEDDGGASDPITKEAYATLRNIAFGYGGCASPGIAICPSCGDAVSWNSYFGRYICSNCGWEGEV